MISYIELNQRNRGFHHFFWTKEDGSTFCEMTRCRLTFGVNCPLPYMAIRTTWFAREDAGEENADTISWNSSTCCSRRPQTSGRETTVGARTKTKHSNDPIHKSTNSAGLFSDRLLAITMNMTLGELI